MGCVRSAAVLPEASTSTSTVQPEGADGSSTGSRAAEMDLVLPTNPAESEEVDENGETKRAESPTASCVSWRSGPAGPTPAQRIYEQLKTPRDVFVQASSDAEVMLYGALRGMSPEGIYKEVIETEFEEKGVECNSAVSGWLAMRKKLAQEGVGVACRKGRNTEMPNQDTVLFCNAGGLTTLGIADGHGETGHWASFWVAQYMLSLLLSEVCWHGRLPDDYNLNRIFNITHEALALRALEDDMDLQLSGCTLTIVIVDTELREAVVAWVGDSRCLLGKPGGHDVEVLTSDHKAESCSGERMRVVTKQKMLVEQDRSATVDSNADGSGKLGIPPKVGTTGMKSPGSSRKNSKEDKDRKPCEQAKAADNRRPSGSSKDSKSESGGEDEVNIEITRSIGDLLRHDYGVIHSPGIKRIGLEAPGIGKNGQFLVCCSYGVWEYLTSKEAARIAGGAGRECADKAADVLLKEARSRWVEDVDEETDDVSVIVVWL